MQSFGGRRSYYKICIYFCIKPIESIMETQKKFISWRRVSTWKQGSSGLGLEAQQTIIDYFIKAENGVLLEDFSEVYTGTDLACCTQLRAAIAKCKEVGATLIIAKTDRFRNTVEALQIYDEMEGNIYFCDLPSTDKFTLTLFFALAEREALYVSIRTKAALDAKKKRGEAVGGTKELWGKNTPGADRAKVLNEARKKMAENKRKVALSNPANNNFWFFIQDWQAIHGELGWQADWKAVSATLNERGIKTSTGMDYTPIRARSAFVRISKQQKGGGVCQ